MLRFVLVLVVLPFKEHGAKGAGCFVFVFLRFILNLAQFFN